MLLQNATFRRKLTPVDLAEVNFSVCDAYYYSYSYFCEDSFDYVAEVVVAYPMVADPTVAVAAVASDCISLHWNVGTNIYLACDQVSFEINKLMFCSMKKIAHSINYSSESKTQEKKMAKISETSNKN